MKNFIMVIIASLCLHFANAQSVGINTDGSAPALGSMLDIKKAGKSKVSIRSTAFDDTTEMQLSNRNSINQGTDFNFTFIRELGFFISNASDIPSNNNDSLFTILPGGNIGIGTRSPESKLDVIGSIKIKDGTQAAGKILTSDANGLASWQNLSLSSPLAFDATGTYPAASNTQSIPSSVATLVSVVNNELNDVANIYNPTLSRATIPSDGWYHIDISVHYSDVEAGTYQISLKDNFIPGGFNLIRSSYHQVATGLINQSFNLQISTDAYFTAGRFLEIQTSQTSGVAQDLRGGQLSWFNMHKLK